MEKRERESERGSRKRKQREERVREGKRVEGINILIVFSYNLSVCAYHSLEKFAVVETVCVSEERLGCYVGVAGTEFCLDVD